jgi:cell division cycle 2-like protein
MAGGRWADSAEDTVLEARRKKEKDEKKRLKAEKVRQAEVDAAKRKVQEEQVARLRQTNGNDHTTKRRRISNDHTIQEATKLRRLLRAPQSGWYPTRNVSNFERLNHIEEGSYGWVSRAREIGTGEVVALKKLKMDSNETGGFPVTGLREIQCLMAARHKHIVNLREIVVGDELDEVFLVMEFLEHDLKTLQEDMSEPFMPSEIKTLLLQLTDAVGFLHDHWILHRDLKTSNILMNNRGEIKLADFGMARYFGDPAPQMTQLVVTLWYRAPELLLGAERYDRAIDTWSIGCVFGELLTKEPLLQGKNEVDQLSKIFELCGVPTDETWPGFKRLPNAKSLRLPRNQQNMGAVIRAKFPFLTASGSDLLTSLLSLNPATRPSAREVLTHPYFAENPRPKSSAMFPTFPSKAGQEKQRRHASPSAPKRGDAPKIVESDLTDIFAAREAEETGAGFQLKLI